MEAHDDSADPAKDRIRRLYDRLAEAVEGLPPDRLEALEEYLDDEQAKEASSEGTTLTGQLREMIGQSGMTTNALAVAAGIPQPVLHRF